MAFLTPPERPGSPPRCSQDRQRSPQEIPEHLPDAQGHFRNTSKTTQDVPKALQDPQNRLQNTSNADPNSFTKPPDAFRTAPDALATAPDDSEFRKPKVTSRTSKRPNVVSNTLKFQIPVRFLPSPCQMTTYARYAYPQGWSGCGSPAWGVFDISCAWVQRRIQLLVRSFL